MAKNAGKNIKKVNSTKPQVEVPVEELAENIEQEPIVEEPTEEPAPEEEKKPDKKATAPKKAPPKAAKKYNPTDTVMCRSVCYGELILEGYKTGLLYTWADCGDFTEVEYQDLQALKSRKSSFLTEPLFIIEDEELVEQWGTLLKPIYDKVTEADVEEMLNLSPSQLKKRLKSVPSGIQESVKNMASAKILDGELDSINRIKVIDEVLGTELMSLIS